MVDAIAQTSIFLIFKNVAIVKDTQKQIKEKSGAPKIGASPK